MVNINMVCVVISPPMSCGYILGKYARCPCLSRTYYIYGKFSHMPVAFWKLGAFQWAGLTVERLSTCPSQEISLPMHINSVVSFLKDARRIRCVKRIVSDTNFAVTDVEFYRCFRSLPVNFFEDG